MRSREEEDLRIADWHLRMLKLRRADLDLAIEALESLKMRQQQLREVSESAR